jgi:hypothetical protein
VIAIFYLEGEAMSREPSSDAELVRLSEDSAHRLLARAIELDDSRGSETTLAELRDVAREAGISAQAFDAAFREFSAMARTRYPSDADSARGKPSNVVIRFWHRLRGGDRRRTAVGDAVVSNTMAVTLFWVFTFLVTRIATNIGWQAMEGAILIGSLVGVGIARRLRARLAEVGLMGFVAFEAAELVMHLIFGLQSVQGGPTHFAVMTAGILGAAIGWIANRKPDGKGELNQAAVLLTSPPPTGPGGARRADGAPPLRTLRLATLARGIWS